MSDDDDKLIQTMQPDDNNNGHHWTCMYRNCASLLAQSYMVNTANTMKGHSFWTKSIMTCQLV